jgi:hypothetical protein
MSRRKPKPRKPRLPVYPVVDLAEHARAALAGAEYHYRRVARICEGWSRTPGSDRANPNELHWHLRAFFWELVAVLDTLKAIPSLNAGKRRVIVDAKASDWYAEVDEWRNFAHRAFLFVQGEFGIGGTLTLLFLPALTQGGSQHQIPERLDYYWKRMEEVINQAIGVAAVVGSDPA